MGCEEVDFQALNDEPPPVTMAHSELPYDDINNPGSLSRSAVFPLSPVVYMPATSAIIIRQKTVSLLLHFFFLPSLHDSDCVITEAFTTLEVLAAYIWRSRIRALKMNPDGNTILCLAVGIRKLLTDPPLPAGYYGNAFVSANAVSPCKSLDQGPLYKVAKMIKESKKAVSSNDQIRRSIDTLEAFVQGNRKVDGGGAAFVLTDWRQLRLSEEVEFGWGLSVNMIPLPWEMFGYVDLCIFLPPCRVNTAMEGGVRVLVSLPGAAMATFNEEMDALKKWSSDNGMPRC
nr:spermidine coumaroyl-CoA acyltransferase-like [Ipomoea trifida]